MNTDVRPDPLPAGFVMPSVEQILRAEAEARDGKPASPWGGELPFRSLRSFENVHGPERWIVQRYVAPTGKTLLSAKPKVGKSTVAYGIAGSLRLGEPFVGLPVAENVGVLYLTEEASPTTITKKGEGAGIDPDDPGFRIMRRVDVNGKVWRKVVEQLRVEAATFKAEGGFSDLLVVVDTLGKWAAFAEGQEQDSGATRIAIEQLDPLCADGHAVLILAHSGWANPRNRGSSAIAGEVDVVLFLEGDAGSPNPRILHYNGGRLDDGETPSKLAIGFDDVGRLEALGEGVGAQSVAKVNLVFKMLAETDGLSAGEVADRMGVSERTAQRHIKALIGAGRAAREDRVGGPGGGQTTIYKAVGNRAWLEAYRIIEPVRQAVRHEDA